MERQEVVCYLPTFRIVLNWRIGFGIGCLPCSLLRLLPESQYRPISLITCVSVELVEREGIWTESYVEEKSLHIKIRCTRPGQTTHSDQSSHTLNPDGIEHGLTSHGAIRTGACDFFYPANE